MTAIEIGTEVRFFRWQATEHVVYRALVRSWTGDPEGHPRINLSYFRAGSPRNQNNVENEEFWDRRPLLDGNDYWKHAFRVTTASESKPYVNPAQDPGDVVWYFRYDASINEHYTHPAIVRAYEGPGPQGNVDLFYITDEGLRQNVNGVPAFLTRTFPATTDYWAMRRLLRGAAAAAARAAARRNR